MKISVVTITADGADLLDVTMQSVACQTYGDVEHIVVDGMSHDATDRIVATYPGAKLIKHERRGLYNALNCGFCHATGDVVGMVHCGDALASPDVLGVVASAFEADRSLDFLYGDLQYVKPYTRKKCRIYHASKFTPDLLMAGITPPHPTLYVRRRVVDKVGYYAEDYYIGADTDMWIRLFTDKALRYRYLPMIMVEMATGGRSTSLKGRLYLNNVEKLKALRANGLPANPLRLAGKYWWSVRDIFLDMPFFKKLWKD